MTIEEEVRFVGAVAVEVAVPVVTAVAASFAVAPVDGQVVAVQSYVAAEPAAEPAALATGFFAPDSSFP